MNFLYILEESIAGFRRAKLAAVSSSITITISLLLLGLFYIVSSNASRLLESVRQKVEIEAFLEEPVSQERIDRIRRSISGIDGIEEVRFISKDEAAKIFKEEFGEDIKSVLDFNPLPPSFKIFLKEGYRKHEKAVEVQDKLKEIKGIENIAYRKDVLSFLDQRAATFYYIALAMGVILCISAILLVSNTIRLTIYAKRRSVQTMKLVGASRWFVRAPFLIEGVLQGMIGGIAAASLIYYLFKLVAFFISGDIMDFIQINSAFYIIIVAAGCGLGLFGSAISVRKYIGETIGG